MLSKKPVIYVAEGYSRARFQEPNPIHLIVYVSARTCLEALSTVLQIRNASDGIKGTVTSLGFPAKPA
ncbi:MAG: hypothetical protein KF716_22760 [Anaerolineae bacterium]|nr:hypothetical protein [Anaerolineae bacterium]